MIQIISLAAFPIHVAPMLRFGRTLARATRLRMSDRRNRHLLARHLAWILIFVTLNHAWGSRGTVDPLQCSRKYPNGGRSPLLLSGPCSPGFFHK
ncbi:hypothetical protein B0H14DRAFT_2691303 [Mycena olivaceomarginata]|nr:hypothetical protein B0H14DRAFT_2691303 [Mycena olivaceomarginata]